MARPHSIPVEMDQPHNVHNHAAKRQRLDEGPDSRAEPAEGHVEEPHLQLSMVPFYQVNSDPRLSESVLQQSFLAPGFYNLPTQPYLNTISSGFESNFARFDHDLQLSSQASRFQETYSLNGDKSYGSLPNVTQWQTGPCNYLATASSVPLNVPTSPSAQWLHHAFHPQPVQAHPLMSVPVSCGQSSEASFQVSHTSQRLSEPPLGETLPKFIPNNEAKFYNKSGLSPSSQPVQDQCEMVCFGMVSRYMLYHKPVRADIHRSRPSPLDMSCKGHVKFHQRFQSKYTRQTASALKICQKSMDGSHQSMDK